MRVNLFLGFIPHCLPIGKQFSGVETELFAFVTVFDRRFWLPCAYRRQFSHFLRLGFQGKAIIRRKDAGLVSGRPSICRIRFRLGSRVLLERVGWSGTDVPWTPGRWCEDGATGDVRLAVEPPGGARLSPNAPGQSSLPGTVPGRQFPLQGVPLQGVPLQGAPMSGWRLP